MAASTNILATHSKVLTKAYVERNGAPSFPNTVREACIPCSAPWTLTNERGATWAGKITRSAVGRCVLSTGWAAFVRDNKVHVGEEVRFEFLPGNVLRITRPAAERPAAAEQPTGVGTALTGLLELPEAGTSATAAGKAAAAAPASGSHSCMPTAQPPPTAKRQRRAEGIRIVDLLKYSEDAMPGPIDGPHSATAAPAVAAHAAAGAAVNLFIDSDNGVRGPSCGTHSTAAAAAAATAAAPADSSGTTVPCRSSSQQSFGESAGGLQEGSLEPTVLQPSPGVSVAVCAAQRPPAVQGSSVAGAEGGRGPSMDAPACDSRLLGARAGVGSMARLKQRLRQCRAAAQVSDRWQAT